MTTNAQDGRNWLERLSAKIPGYSGYVNRERRRDMDKLHREHLADRLRSLKTPLTDAIRELSSSGRLFEVTPLDRLSKKLDRIENRVRFADYGYSGFFDVVKIEEAQLDGLYRFDLMLTEQVDNLETKVRELKAGSGEAERLKATATDFENAIDEFDRKFDERQRSINNYNPNQPFQASYNS